MVHMLYFPCQADDVLVLIRIFPLPGLSSFCALLHPHRQIRNLVQPELGLLSCDLPPLRHWRFCWSCILVPAFRGSCFLWLWLFPTDLFFFLPFQFFRSTAISDWGLISRGQRRQWLALAVLLLIIFSCRACFPFSILVSTLPSGTFAALLSGSCLLCWMYFFAAFSQFCHSSRCSRRRFSSVLCLKSSSETLADSGGGTLAFTGGGSGTPDFSGDCCLVRSAGWVAVSCRFIGLTALSFASPSITATMSGLDSSSVGLPGGDSFGFFLFPTFCSGVSPLAVVELVLGDVASSFFSVFSFFLLTWSCRSVSPLAVVELVLGDVASSFFC